jgi:hypothetical protein
VGDRLDLRHVEFLGFWCVALSTLEHAVAHELLEHTQGAGLMQTTFVATHGGHAARTTKGGAAFFGFIAQTIVCNFGDFFFAHARILLKRKGHPKVPLELP